MFWPVLIALIILWAVIQKNIVETTGRSPQSRSSLRRQRREARKLGIDPQDLHVNFRSKPVDHDDIKATVDRVGWILLPFVLLVFGYFAGALLGWWH